VNFAQLQHYDGNYLRTLLTIAILLAWPGFLMAQPATSDLPDAPQPAAEMLVASAATESSSAAVDSDNIFQDSGQAGSQTASKPADAGRPGAKLDAEGNPIPLERQEPKRILGFMPNFRSVSAGSKPHPPGWNYNFKISTHQAFDYSTFVFLGLTSLTAEWTDAHPALGKGAPGFYAYTWRGFLDKTDGTYLSGWLLPSLLHEDTRFYPLGNGHRIITRALYVISRQGVARTYGGSQTPNIAGLGGKVLTQIVSREYYPPGATDFSVLATKFAYSAMRDIAFSSVREFYPDIAAHYIRKHRQKMLLKQQQQMGAPQGSPQP
jgi:hypothetical protein